MHDCKDILVGQWVFEIICDILKHMIHIIAWTFFFYMMLSLKSNKNGLGMLKSMIFIC